MIAKPYRFHGHRSITQVLRGGQRVSSRYWTIKWRPAIRSEARLAIIVSRKVAKGAVVRNRIRRRLFETLRQTMQLADGSVDMVVLVHDAAIAELPQPELDKLIQGQLAAMLDR